MKLTFSILVIFLIATDTSGQNDSLKNENDTLQDRFFLLPKVDRDGVTMPEVEIKEVTVFARSGSSRRSDYRKYERIDHEKCHCADPGGRAG